MTQGFFSTTKNGLGHAADKKAPEALAVLPRLDAEASYINYGCHLECFLDSGMVLHKALPQSAQPVDTLGSYDLAGGSALDVVVGENLKSLGTYKDIIQRMATSRYRFLLSGFGVRVGYPVPVPTLRTIAGIPATPGKQWVHGNEVVGNFYGIPVFRNAWELWYIIAVPPQRSQLPPPNLAQHIAADQALPDAVAVAVCPNDYNARPNFVIAPKGGG